MSPSLWFHFFPHRARAARFQFSAVAAVRKMVHCKFHSLSFYCNLYQHSLSTGVKKRVSDWVQLRKQTELYLFVRQGYVLFASGS